ncbi:DUF3987 domain-containing protein, partial [Geminicoccus flavidas]|uniref:DUF3987 domain-containing protein n=1 Tax=Geminicoccus flavidas TaxID=2506407 RepID=UPI001357ECD9
ARLANANPRGLIHHRDELTGWVGSMDRYGGNGSDRSFWLEAYGGRRRVVDRIKDGGKAVVVPSLSMAILGGVQPDRLATIMLAGDDDGLAARFIYAFPNARRPTRPTCTPDDDAALQAFRRLWTLPMDQPDGVPVPRILPFSETAAAALQTWREQIADMEKTSTGLFVSWLGKLPGMAVRIATILTFIWWSVGLDEREPQEIGSQAVTAALAILEAWAIPMSRRAMGEAALPEADRDAAALARWTVTNVEPGAEVNASHLRTHHAPIGRTADRYDAAFAILEDAGWVRRKPRSGGSGRQPKVYETNPKAWKQP